jgi:hypothetical protein
MLIFLLNFSKVRRRESEEERKERGKRGGVEGIELGRRRAKEKETKNS